MKIYKSLALGITLATIGAVASTASAGDDVKFYVGGKIGGAVFDSDMRYQAVNDDKLGTGAALELNPFVGMQINWNDSLATKFEIEQFNIATGEYEESVSLQGEKFKEKYQFVSSGLFANAYLNFLPNNFASPFIGAGIGWSHNKLKAKLEEDVFDGHWTYSEDFSKNSFAWHADVGATLNVSQHLAVDLNLRYTDLGKIGKFYDTGEDIDLSTVDFLAGVRYVF